MASSNVLITFYSRCGSTEKLAAAAAVGAVQARALIRLRRIPDTDQGGETGECREAVARMQKEYVPPTPSDVEWADAIVFADSGEGWGEWSAFRRLLQQLSDEGGLDGKVGVVISESESNSPPVSIENLSLTVLPLQHGEKASEVHDALIQGRRAAVAGRDGEADKPTWEEMERLLPDSHDIG